MMDKHTIQLNGSRKLFDMHTQRQLLYILFYFLVFVFAAVSLFHFQTTSDKAMLSCATQEKPHLREYGNGWHSIEVFYGKTDHFEKKLPDQEWFAQVQQDVIVSRVFRNKTSGYFIDLASNDATDISNTYSLEKKFKWTGLCIEPNPHYWSGLAHRDCQVVAAVIGEKRMEEITFKFSHLAFGGIVREDFDNKDATDAETKYTTPLTEIFSRFSVPTSIDYFSLDVEGAEEFIMRHFPFNLYTFKFMSVERPKDGLKALLKENGYEYVGEIGWFGETLWAHTSTKHLLDLDSIAEFLKTQ